MRRPALLAIVALASAFAFGAGPRWGAAATPPSADDIVAAVRRATAQYQDIARAGADGFVQVSGMEARHGYHFMNINAQLFTAPSAAVGRLDLARPPMLLYVERDGVWRLAGVEYALPSPPKINAFPGTQWQQHEASCHYRDYREIPGRRATDCPPSHPKTGEPFVLWHPAFAVAHVWAWIPSPDGPFSDENPALASYGGAAPRDAGHRHPLSATEHAYSQVTHRLAGAVVLVLAGLITWESWRPRRFPWSSVLWILFGLYLIPTSDPESWPWGPKRFVDIFSDRLVLQHKVLALMPITIGAVTALSSVGLLARRRWISLVAPLVVLSGASLFLHFHDDRVHLNAGYLQHVMMGITALSLGLVLFVTRHGGPATPRAQAFLRGAWPGLLAVLGLVLLCYVER